MFTCYEQPRKPEPKRRALLKEWHISKKDYRSNKLWMNLKGTVYGHPSFADGTHVETSPIVYLDAVNGIAETMHTIYILA